MLRIHPNPTTGNFIIELAEENINDGVKIEIFGMRGESYLKAGIGGSRQHEFSLSTYPAGIYFIRVVSGEKAETVKIIKQ